jgi:ATP-dependent exoDNAse (exonuclease V) beta subunit
MFDYSICKDITAETTEKGRLYKTPDGSFPSVTTILGKTANNIWLQRWKDRVGEEEATRISKAATDRGEIVHSYLEKFWNKENSWIETLRQEDPTTQKMITNLIEATQRGVTGVWAQEIPVWSKQLRYAGRVDMFGEWNKVPAVIDFKTSKKKKQVKDIKDYFIQCTAYAHAHNEIFKTSLKKIVVLITVENSDVQVFESQIMPYIPELKYRVLQYEKLNENQKNI